ncbi:transcriptional regulator [Pseudomonas aeruginosa]|uniref:transcriptional regulator n=1 Tax=Pseudomonas aeruginosa TaxID=287 RepID=UPI00101D5D08|nr:helix-turn-helix domain-containing protein [Pseudomonas aeruginosa]RYI97754.1 helix-turn-helix domain-containing protein [Pseudomonas aeruginosa]HEK3715049.1 helix-turn-helix domain-containing protein [Pseudomonas aeruginosa]
MTSIQSDADQCRQALEKVLALCDGNQSELARRCGVKQPHVWKWLRAGRVPVERVPSVVAAVDGLVRAHELRPDLPQLFPHPAPAPKKVA